jgi:hypothetical protein
MSAKPDPDMASEPGSPRSPTWSAGELKLQMAERAAKARRSVDFSVAVTIVR